MGCGCYLYSYWNNFIYTINYFFNFSLVEIWTEQKKEIHHKFLVNNTWLFFDEIYYWFSIKAIEAIEPAKTGYLGGLDLPNYIMANSGLLLAMIAYVIGKFLRGDLITLLLLPWAFLRLLYIYLKMKIGSQEVLSVNGLQDQFVWDWPSIWTMGFRVNKVFQPPCFWNFFHYSKALIFLYLSFDFNWNFAFIRNCQNLPGAEWWGQLETMKFLLMQWEKI